jgi:DNA-binding NarL/FixJ family response regulator
MRVFVIAEAPLARAGMEELLRRRKVRLAGSAARLGTAEPQIAASGADVLLLEADGEELERIAKEVSDAGIAAEIPVVILASDMRAAEAAAALRAGVRGVLPAETAPEQLVAALEAAAAGLLVLHPEDLVATMPVASSAQGARIAELVEPLTPREREVLQMLASGLANKIIAVRLGISEHTVKFHVAAILGKLGAESRTEAVALGIRRGLIML